MPTRPTQISEYAAEALVALGATGLGHRLSLGGALGLQHYLEYRSTHDVDAWWDPEATADERQEILSAVEKALRSFGSTRLRQWGEVTSLELAIEGKTVFSFQVAVRSARLELPTVLPWVDVSIDSLPDLVASKMVALVERGAPRDFRDIHALCQAGLVNPPDCWRLWRERQTQAGSDTGSHRALLAVQTHLARIEQHRPLAGIPEPERTSASNVRRWFTEELLYALVD